MDLKKLLDNVYTVGSKIIRALEIIRPKKLRPNAVLWNNGHIRKLHTKRTGFRGETENSALIWGSV